MKPASSTAHRKIPRARAGTSLKKQTLRRDPRGRIILRGSPGFASALESRVPTVEPPPGRLVGSVDRIARPRGSPVTGKKNTAIVSDVLLPDGGNNIGQTGPGGNGIDPDGARFGGREAVGAAEPPPKEGGASATIGRVATQQQHRTATPPEEEKIKARTTGGVGGAEEGASTADRAATREAATKVRAPPEEVESQQAREHAPERGRERERGRDGDVSDREEDERPPQQPHQQDVSGDEGAYGRRKTYQSHSDTDETPPPTAAGSDGEVVEVARPAIPPDELNYE